MLNDFYLRRTISGLSPEELYALYIILEEVAGNRLTQESFVLAETFVKRIRKEQDLWD